MKLNQKAKTQLTETYDQRNEADFRNLTQPKMDIVSETDFNESKPKFTKKH